MINREEFNKVYPVWKWSLMGWMILGLLVLSFSIIFIVMSNVIGPYLIFLSIMCTVIFGLCLVGFVFQILSRVIEYDGVVIFKNFGSSGNLKPIAFRVDPNSVWVDDSDNRRRIVGDIVKMVQNDIVDNIERVLNRRVLKSIGFVGFHSTRKNIWNPVTFVNFVKRKTPKNNLLDRFNRYCAGISNENWLDIECESDKDLVNDTRCAIADFILRRNFPDRDAIWRSQIIGSAIR